MYAARRAPVDAFPALRVLGQARKPMGWDMDPSGGRHGFEPDAEQTASDEGLSPLSTAQLVGVQTKRIERFPALNAVAGRALGMVFRLGRGETLIGRADDAEISLQDDGISRRHAKLVRQGEAFVVHDLGSTNGTFVNDVQIKSPTLLAEGDFLRIGSKTVLRFEIRDAYHDHVQGKLYELATRDPLTQALNRRAYNERLENEWAWAIRHKNPCAIVAVDADHFKRVNDDYGHAAGDYVLVEISRILDSMIRREDALARIGGEEFVILARATALDAALALAERARSTIESHPFEFEGKRLKVTISLGVSTSSDKRLNNATELMAQADGALYRAKHNGRNRVETLSKV
jgi:two-component system, cell cycle response regulator